MTPLQTIRELTLLISINILLTLDQLSRTQKIKKATQIIQKFSLLIFFETILSFKLVTENEIHQVIKCLNAKTQLRIRGNKQ